MSEMWSGINERIGMNGKPGMSENAILERAQEELGVSEKGLWNERNKNSGMIEKGSECVNKSLEGMTTCLEC